jgi:lantibiotic modifying enzyme
VRGFETVGAIFTNRKSAQDFHEQVFSAARLSRETRALFRPSAEYARILVESLMPERMTSRNGRRRWLAQKCSATAGTRAVAKAEARALFHCDIPKFSTRRRGAAISPKDFLAAIAQLKSAPTLLRRRVLFGTSRLKKTKTI